MRKGYEATQPLSKGFSLVELMVAMVLGLFITAAVLQTFLSLKRTYTFTEEFSKIQENGRFAISFLSKDVRSVGNFGCLSTFFNADENLLSDLNTSDDDKIEAAITLTTPINGFNNVLNTFTEYPNVVPGTDVIVIKTLDGNSSPLLPPFVNSPTRDMIHVDPQFGGEQGELMVITNCDNAFMFQATGLTENADDIEVHVGDSGAFTPGNSLETIDEVMSLTEGAFIASYRSMAYYIRNNANGIPSLYRTRLNTDSDNDEMVLVHEELVEGVEDMQILYGVDAVADDGMNSPNYYAAAETPNLDMNNVVSVQINLMLVSIADNLADTAASQTLPGTGIPGIVDRRIRKEFTIKIALRNRLN